jgi:putative DNA primase/helicase
MGYSATGRTIEQIFLFAYGDGQTGKGTFIRLMESIFGGYMTTVNSNVFLTRKGEPHPTEIADFQGMRLIVAQEFEDDAVWNEALLKSLTGSDTVKARRMHADFFHFEPTHTIFLAGNSLPSLRRVDHAIRRRVRLIPFMHVAPKELRDKNYESRMKANELPGILQWVIDGAITWYKEGLGKMPTNVLTETNNYFESVDDLGIWLADNTVTDPEGFVSLAALHKPWTIFQRECGVVNVDSPRIFGDKLQFRGYPRARLNKARGHKGLRLIDKENMETTLCSTCLGTGRVALNTKEKV